MIVIPAIDLIEQSVVRLTQGEFSDQTNYTFDPVELAISYADAGFKRLHVVDLEGAKKGEPVHLDLVRRMCNNTSLRIDFGGGVRKESDVKSILDAGVAMVNIGSIAVNSPELLRAWIKKFGAQYFFLGADVLDHYIATHAWRHKSELHVSQFIDYWMKQGITEFFSTDVSKDGKLEGPGFDLYTRLIQEFPDIDMVASGGVSGLSDLAELERIGVSGVIVGKAIYENRISVEQLKRWT